MKLQLWALPLLLILSPFSAGAGEILGTLDLPESIEKSKVAVWLEGEGLGQEVPEASTSISQRGTKFEPDFLVISVGESVEMPNDDDIAHNVFSYSEANPFNLGIYPKGDLKVVQFDHPGIVEMYCSIHRHMSATVCVVPSSARMRTDEEGGFRFESIAPGKYRLKLWGRKLGEHSYPIDVPNDGVMKVKYSPKIEEKQPS